MGGAWEEKEEEGIEYVMMMMVRYRPSEGGAATDYAGGDCVMHLTGSSEVRAAAAGTARGGRTSGKRRLVSTSALGESNVGDFTGGSACRVGGMAD